MNVIELSWYIIRRCYDNGNPITHLQLQRLLYILQVENIRIKDKPLFNDVFYIKPYMPIIQKVFNTFNVYSSLDLTPTKYDPNPSIRLEDKLTELIDEFCNLNFWERKLTDNKWDKIKHLKTIGIEDIREIY